MTVATDQWHAIAQQIRLDSIRTSSKAKSGHPGLPMGAADIGHGENARRLRRRRHDERQRREQWHQDQTGLVAVDLCRNSQLFDAP